jgi:hypothetical protein
MKKRTVTRNTTTGEFVSPAEAVTDPTGTVTETIETDLRETVKETPQWARDAVHAIHNNRRFYVSDAAMTEAHAAIIARCFEAKER